MVLLQLGQLKELRDIFYTLIKVVKLQNHIFQAFLFLGQSLCMFGIIPEIGVFKLDQNYL